MQPFRARIRRRNRTAVHIHGEPCVPWISDGGPFDWWAPNGTHGLSFLNNQVLRIQRRLRTRPSITTPTTKSAGRDTNANLGLTRTNAYAGIATGYIIRDDFERAMKQNGLPSSSKTVSWVNFPSVNSPSSSRTRFSWAREHPKTINPTWEAQGLPSAPGASGTRMCFEKNRWKLIGAGSRLPNPSVIAGTVR